MSSHELFMRRCLQLAALGRRTCRPNPMVGAVLVHEGRIIGEGWHKRYGGPHAEVEAFASVADADRALIPDSTLYVSLEPCNHHGKTPPCSERIISEGVRQVVVGTVDFATHVNGAGIRRLREAGINVICPVLETECRELNKRFFTLQQKKRPYIILKWAQTMDGFLGPGDKPMRLSDPFSDRLVHRWRAEEASIWVGYRTARTDRPVLTNRLWPGPHPLRIVYDRDRSLDRSMPLFDQQAPTLAYHSLADTEADLQVSPDNYIPEILHDLARRGIDSVLVEGGAALHGALIKQNLWDEIRVVTCPLRLGAGVKACSVPGQAIASAAFYSGPDHIQIFRNPARPS